MVSDFYFQEHTPLYLEKENPTEVPYNLKDDYIV